MEKQTSPRAMNWKLLKCGRFFGRKIHSRYEFYWGLCVGIVGTSDSRDWELTFIIPCFAFQLSISKNAKVIKLNS